MAAVIDLRLGRWQDVLAGETCDALIFDAPYSASDSDAADVSRADGYDAASLRPSYDAFTPELVREVCESWAPRTRGWMVSITDYDLSFVWRDEMARVGRYAFRQPIACVVRAMSYRAQHDGPSSWTLYAMASRPSTLEYAAWGVRDGAYVGSCGGNGRRGGSERGGGRGKWPWLMQAIVRDYSRPGDVVCDPFAGWGATLAAAASLGRRAIGAEVDADAHAEALRRLARPMQADLFASADTG
jgi:hypothetical protein